MALLHASARKIIVLSAILTTGCSANGIQPHADAPVQTAKENLMSTVDLKTLDTLVADATSAQKSAEFETANSLLDDAVALIGDRYLRPNMIDDTGMKLALAKAEAKKGNLETAVALKKSVVESRRAILTR
jgi:hypothetical protein